MVESSASLPASPPDTPGFPQNPVPILFEGFSTLNTKASRQGIRDDEMSICDGWMPLGANNLRILPGLGPTLYTASAPGQVIGYFSFGVLGNTPFTSSLTPVCLVFNEDGSANQVSQQTLAVSTIAGSGTFGLGLPGLQPIPGKIAVAQWGRQWSLIVTQTQANGYWLWDGAVLFGAGTLGPSVDITESGSGYTSPPTVTAAGGSGAGATFAATVVNGSVTKVKVTNPGSGYQVTDIGKVILTFSGGGSDSQASANVSTATSGGVRSVNVVAGGSGYSARTRITATGSPTVQPSFAIQAINGTIVSVVVIHPGIGVDPSASLIVTDPASPPGNSATLQPFVVSGQVASATITSPGTGYSAAPEITVIGDGQGATAVVNGVSGGGITGITITNPGTGYTWAAFVFSGGNRSATATVNLMPFGIQGNTIEIYQDRVWIGNGDTITYSAPGDPADFDVGNGSGVFVSSDAYLRYAYISLKQTNGFLYLLGDSSIDYISGVNTAGTPAITTFSKLNVNPQIGVHDPIINPNTIGNVGNGGTTDMVQLFSQSLVLTNHNGIYASYGGAVSKVSSPIDGLYGAATGLNQFMAVQSSAAVTNIFGVEVYMFLQSVLDQFTGLQVNKLFMWDTKRWWTSDQNWISFQPQFIASDTNFVAYYTDRTRIAPMFQAATTGFFKTTQSRLWYQPNVYFTKTAKQIYLITQVKINDGQQIALYVGTETSSPGDQTNFTIAGTGSQLFHNFVPATYGQEIGMTLRTQASDITLVSAALLVQLQQTKY